MNENSEQVYYDWLKNEVLVGAEGVCVMAGIKPSKQDGFQEYAAILETNYKTGQITLHVMGDAKEFLDKLNIHEVKSTVRYSFENHPFSGEYFRESIE